MVLRTPGTIADSARALTHPRNHPPLFPQCGHELGAASQVNNAKYEGRGQVSTEKFCAGSLDRVAAKDENRRRYGCACQW